MNIAGSRPIISVLMSVFNEQEKWLIESINSILIQTYTNFEFIIINDNPKRQTNKEILEEFARKDARIFIVKNEINIGLTKSLNRGLKLAKGKYIARMDADDISHRARFEEQVSYLEKNPEVGLLGTRFKFINNGSMSRLIKYPINNEAIKSSLLLYNCIAHPSVMIRKQVLEKFNIQYNEKFKKAQDFDLWVKLSEHTKISNISKCLLYYRLHENQISAKGNVQQSSFALDVCKEQLDNFTLNYSAKDLIVHKSIHAGFLESGVSIYNCQNWLEKILDHNAEIKRYNEKELKRICFNRWSFLLQNSRLGIKGIKIYLFSTLLNFESVILEDLIITILKLLLNWKVRTNKINDLKINNE